MTKIELTISPDYVPNWTVADAMRELFQNAIDQQAQNPDNKMAWLYDRESETVMISNKSSKLTANSLLLGSTTKANDTNTIGQFGEGYKIATLVLLRNNKTVTFYNRAENEIWRPRFVDSRRFGTKILTFFIEKSTWPWNRTNNDDLTIEVSDITEDEFDNEITPTNLYIKDAEIIESTEFGDILADKPGQVFVNGLFVCEYDPYKYGYNFRPQYIKLDRDRKMASDFDLKWLASRIWAISRDKDTVIDLISNGVADVEYIDYMNNNLAENLFARFIVKYGHNAVPVTTQEELEKLPSQYHGIIVSSQYKSIISKASGYNEPSYDTVDPLDELNTWFDKISAKLTDEETEEFTRIFDKLGRE